MTAQPMQRSTSTQDLLLSYLHRKEPHPLDHQFLSLDTLSPPDTSSAASSQLTLTSQPSFNSFERAKQSIVYYDLLPSSTPVNHLSGVGIKAETLEHVPSALEYGSQDSSQDDDDEDVKMAAEVLDCLRSLPILSRRNDGDRSNSFTSTSSTIFDTFSSMNDKDNPLACSQTTLLNGFHELLPKHSNGETTIPDSMGQTKSASRRRRSARKRVRTQKSRSTDQSTRMKPYPSMTESSSTSDSESSEYPVEDDEVAERNRKCKSKTQKRRAEVRNNETIRDSDSSDPTPTNDAGGGGLKLSSQAKKSRTCDICHKKFSSTFNLTSHLKVHTQERPFSCSICGRLFARKHDCERHSRSHMQDRSHQCKCGKSYTRSDALSRHLARKETPLCEELYRELKAQNPRRNVQ